MSAPLSSINATAARLLSALNPHVPPWLDSIVMRAIECDLERRYQSYSEMHFDLENPEKVRPYYRPGMPLLERNPLFFYKAGFFVLLLLHLVWLVWALLR